MNLALKILLFRCSIPFIAIIAELLYQERATIRRMAQEDIGIVKAVAGNILAVGIVISEVLHDWWKSKNIGSLFSFRGKH